MNENKKRVKRGEREVKKLDTKEEGSTGGRELILIFVAKLLVVCTRIN